MQVTVTYNQVLNFRRVAAEYLKGKKESHFTYALNKMLRATKALHEDYADKETSIRVEFASVDKEKNLIVNGGAYAYTKENADKLSKRTRELLNTSVTVDNYIATSVPEDIDSLQWEIFTPFVLTERPDPSPVKADEITQ